MKHIEVVAAIIVNDNKILCVQRGESKLDYISKKYEFPGGKMEVGEKREETIKREISEKGDHELINNIRKGTKIGKPLGDAKFIKKM